MAVEVKSVAVEVNSVAVEDNSVATEQAVEEAVKDLAELVSNFFDFLGEFLSTCSLFQVALEVEQEVRNCVFHDVVRYCGSHLLSLLPLLFDFLTHI